MSRLADRVQETTTTTGTAAKVLAGAVAGYRGFVAALGPGGVYYAEVHQSLAEWEVGIGTISASPDTITPTSIQSSSNAGAAVNFSAGLKNIFCTIPAAIFVTAGLARVQNLRGAPNATTPLTKYDLTADGVQLIDPVVGSFVANRTPGTLTNDIGLAGATANGRDQSGSFTASSWIYLYYIWNGTTLATVSSASATLPTRPTGYTHVAGGIPLRLNASTQIVPTVMRDDYASIVPSMFRTSGAGTGAEQTYDLSASIPPLHAGANIVMQTNNGSFQGDVRVAASGQVALTTNIGFANIVVLTGRVPLVSQTLYYIGSASQTASLGLQGYWMKF